jgi:hypothetical protein
MVVHARLPHLDSARAALSPRWTLCRALTRHGPKTILTDLQITQSPVQTPDKHIYLAPHNSKIFRTSKMVWISVWTPLCLTHKQVLYSVCWCRLPSPYVVWCAERPTSPDTWPNTLGAEFDGNPQSTWTHQGLCSATGKHPGQTTVLAPGTQQVVPNVLVMIHHQASGPQRGAQHSQWEGSPPMRPADDERQPSRPERFVSCEHVQLKVACTIMREALQRGGRV